MTVSTTTNLTYGTLESPIGELLLVGTDRALHGLYMQAGPRPQALGVEWQPDSGALDPVRRQLDEYFAGRRTAFEVDVAFAGTPFQAKVWRALTEIPYGETISYGELARRIGQPTAVRAVGLANGRNPVSVVVPCHRVIGADGSLTGFGGGVERKLTLLELEGAAIQPRLADGMK